MKLLLFTILILTIKCEVTASETPEKLFQCSMTFNK